MKVETKNKTVSDVILGLLGNICKKRFALDEVPENLYLWCNGEKRKIKLSEIAKKLSLVMVNEFVLEKDDIIESIHNGPCMMRGMSLTWGEYKYIEEVAKSIQLKVKVKN